VLSGEAANTGTNIKVFGIMPQSDDRTQDIPNSTWAH